jgi:hypothetical protein
MQSRAAQMTTTTQKCLPVKAIAPASPRQPPRGSRRILTSTLRQTTTQQALRMLDTIGPRDQMDDAARTLLGLVALDRDADALARYGLTVGPMMERFRASPDADPLLGIRGSCRTPVWMTAQVHKPDSGDVRGWRFWMPIPNRRR